ncbi:cytosolic non-specific dipeptidase [Leptinotarsa decemlineata]|uniref:cytosolic non-specific dipeptidase n=1 Tax=Leptinotarsa decemlineata TaxID=7539 RepID=UPI003D30A481
MVYPHSYRTEHSETKTTNSVYGEYYEAMKSKKIKIQPALLTILQFIDSNRIGFIDDLKEAVQIKSVTSKLEYRNEVKKMIKFTESWLKKLDMKYECFNIGFYELDGEKVRLPPVILASLGNDPKKKTVCAYLHLDVPDPSGQPWDTDPWTLTNIKNVFYGSGAACGKGPLMAWFHVIQAFKDSNMTLPVNLKVVIESMNHQNSQGFADFVATRSQDFFNTVDYVVECDSEWLGDKYPCIIYGTVGILHFQVTIEKSENSKTEIKDDMENIFKALVNEEGTLKIKGFYDYVEQITPDEEKIYENIQEFDPAEIRESLPPHKRSWDKVKLLMSFWRLPSIYVDDIEECICDKKDFLIIKRNFIIKIVPKQVCDRVDKLTRQHIQNSAKKLNIENKVTCKLVASTRPWYENYRSPSFAAARKAFIQIYKEDPNLIREDRGRETATIFDNVLEKNMIILPLCSKGTNSGEANEHISSRNYFEGTKVIAAYLFQIAQTREE